MIRHLIMGAPESALVLDEGIWYINQMSEDKKRLLVLNPAAGKGAGKKKYARYKRALEDSFPNLETKESLYPGHLGEIGKNALEQEVQHIISIGGDGTAFELINGLYLTGSPQTNLTLSMLPAGTGNSFLRDFGPINEEHWINKASGKKTRAVDLVEFEYHAENKPQKKYFLNIMGIGLIADVLKITNRRLKWMGDLGYSVGVLLRLFKGMNNRINVTVDGQVHEFKNSALVINNSKYTGGAMKIAPQAETADGMVDIVVFENVNRREILQIFKGVFKGTHIHHPKVKLLKGADIKITAEPNQMLMADGELLGETPMNLRVLPKELSITL